jgi:hypothetical protein
MTKIAISVRDSCNWEGLNWIFFTYPLCALKLHKSKYWKTIKKETLFYCQQLQLWLQFRSEEMEIKIIKNREL